MPDLLIFKANWKSRRTNKEIKTPSFKDQKPQWTPRCFSCSYFWILKTTKIITRNNRPKKTIMVGCKKPADEIKQTWTKRRTNLHDDISGKKMVEEVDKIKTRVTRARINDAGAYWAETNCGTGPHNLVVEVFFQPSLRLNFDKPLSNATPDHLIFHFFSFRNSLRGIIVFKLLNCVLLARIA